MFATTLQIRRTGPEGNVTDHELIALAVCQAIVGMPSDRQFLGVIGRLLPGFFPQLPTQSRYNRRLRRLAPYLTTVQLQVAELIASGRVRLVDGTLIGCANYAGCKHVSDFAGYAAYGYCRSKSEWVWGVRLVLLSDAAGVPVGYTIAPANEREYEPCFQLASAHPGTILFADKGFWGAEFKRTLNLVDVHLITPEKHRLGERPPAEVAKARVRLVIESVFSNLKRQMRLGELFTSYASLPPRLHSSGGVRRDDRAGGRPHDGASDTHQAQDQSGVGHPAASLRGVVAIRRRSGGCSCARFVPHGPVCAARWYRTGNRKSPP